MPYSFQKSKPIPARGPAIKARKQGIVRQACNHLQWAGFKGLVKASWNSACPTVAKTASTAHFLLASWSYKPVPLLSSFGGFNPSITRMSPMGNFYYESSAFREYCYHCLCSTLKAQTSSNRKEKACARLWA